MNYEIDLVGSKAEKITQTHYSISQLDESSCRRWFAIGGITCQSIYPSMETSSNCKIKTLDGIILFFLRNFVPTDTFVFRCQKLPE